MVDAIHIPTNQGRDLMDVLECLNFAFEAYDRSSVYLVADIEKYSQKDDVDPNIIVELENAKRYEVDAVYFRFFEGGRTPLPQIYIYDNIKKSRREGDNVEIHKNLWSAGIVPVYFIIDRYQLRIYDGRQPVEIQKNGETSVEPIDYFALGDISEVNRALKQYDARLFDNGEFWDKENESEHFLNDKSVYEKLLSGLRAVRKRLSKNKTLSNVVDRLLIMSVLIKYLEENGTDETGANHAAAFFKEHVGCDSLVQTIREGRYVALLDALALHFNGGVFKLSDEERRVLSNSDLTDFAAFLEGTLEGEEYVLWKEYSFKHIPIELISNFYEEFLPIDNITSKRQNGAYYTPYYLVRLLVDESLPLQKGNLRKVIDVSCGSGIFLVTAFKRLVQIWRYNNEWALPTPEKLEEILSDYIFGVDLNANAVQLTIFSLNLSLCSMLSSRQIWTDLKFVDINNKNIFNDDFFNFVSKCNHDFGIVIGNPPFVEYKEKQYEEYRLQLEQTGMPLLTDIPRYNSSLMFLDASMHLLEQGGKLCMIMPTSPMLYGGGDFRQSFFSTYHVGQVIDFTFLKNVLFNNARVATVALFAENREPDGQDVLHIVAKHTLTNREKIFFEFDYYDFYSVPQTLAADSGDVWKANLMGGVRAFNILTKYETSPSIKDYLLKQRRERKWEFGEGYQIGNAKEPADYITGHLCVDDREFNDDGTFTTYTVEEKLFQWPRKQSLYEPPHLLVKRTIGRSAIPVALSDDYLTFKEGIIGVHSPESDRQELQKLADYLTENNALLRFLIILHSNRAGKTRSVYTHYMSDFLRLPYMAEGEVMTEEERIVVNDALDYYLPYFDRIVNLKMDEVIDNPEELQEFGEIYSKALNAIYQDGRKKYSLSNVYIGPTSFICVFSYSDKDRDARLCNTSTDLEMLLEYVGEDYIIKRVVRAYTADSIVMIKPRQRRYWLKSMALRDADETFNDIMSKGDE